MLAITPECDISYAEANIRRQGGHAQRLAGLQRLDHAGFRQRVSTERGTAAENVGFGCDTEDCAIRKWAGSGRHRANMRDFRLGNVTRRVPFGSTGVAPLMQNKYLPNGCF